MTPLEALVTLSCKTKSLKNENRRAQASLNKLNFRRREGFLATSANQTKTLDEIPYEHWTWDRKPENEYLKKS
jgi:hypothetical protein